MPGTYRGVRLSPAYRSYRNSVPPLRSAVVQTGHRESSVSPLHLGNPPLADGEVKPWPPAWLPDSSPAELQTAYIHSSAQVSQSLQLLEKSIFILYEM